LHRFTGTDGEGVAVDTSVSVVDDGAMASSTPRNDTDGTGAQSLKFLGKAIREN
jgi:hypothetical protein